MSSFGSVASRLSLAFVVRGPGDPQLSASRIAFNSALARRGISLSRESCAFSPPCPSSSSFSSMVVFRIADRMRSVRRPQSFVDTDRSKAAGLEDTYELQPDHFEQRQKRDDQPAAIVHVREQILEAARLGLAQSR